MAHGTFRVACCPTGPVCCRTKPCAACGCAALALHEHEDAVEFCGACLDQGSGPFDACELGAGD